MNKVALLDLGGVIIKEPANERVTDESMIQLFEDTVQALKKLGDAGFEAIIITNQAGIGEGLITADQFQGILSEVMRLIAPSGLKVLKTYICPHSLDEECECRKPKPGMILRAAKEFNIELSNTFMIGDHETDMQAAKSAGARGILVKTTVTHQIDSSDASYVTGSLTEAVDYVVGAV